MYPTEVIIDLGALRRNFQALQAHAGACELVPVIKSDAYGHGLIPAAVTLLAAGAKRLAVFRLAEALDLCQAGITVPIWVLLGALPDEAEHALGRQNLCLACPSLANAKMLSALATRQQTCLPIHLKIDTGMGRLGILASELPTVLPAITALPSLRLQGAFSHLAKAEDSDHPVTRQQIERFQNLLSKLPPSCRENHLCASSGWLHRHLPNLPFARPGLSLFTPAATPEGKAVSTASVMTLRSRLVEIKDLPAGSAISYNCTRILERPSRVAIVPLGYDDGYSRQLSNRGEALVRGQRAAILGNVCMSMTMLDVTDIEGANLDDEAVFLGKQGDQEINAHELADRAGTVTQEILCAIGKMAPGKLFA